MEARRRQQESEDETRDNHKNKKKSKSFIRNICCCFNADLCCGWYKPRPCVMIIVVLISMYECFNWLIFGVLLFLTPEESIATDMYWLFSYFNPFIKEDQCNYNEKDCENDEQLLQRNMRIIRNFFIICLP
jgi:hypothetical protein